ncbi:hypothetical protein ACS5NO_08190 [Larkinella sp. GY13]
MAVLTGRNAEFFGGSVAIGIGPIHPIRLPRSCFVWLLIHRRNGHRKAKENDQQIKLVANV